MQFNRFRSLVWSLALFALGFLALGVPSPASGSPGPEEPHTHGVHPSATDRQRAPHPEAAGTAESEGADVDEASDEKDKWSVDEAPGPKRDIEIEVDEGTWMSVDVSPDGTMIVFDLLGDLYEMPIDGGRAKPITAGVSWDMQPRYSPDGSKIAFTSDRGGGDNLWVIKRLEAAVPSIFATDEDTTGTKSPKASDGSSNEITSPEGAQQEDPNSIAGTYTGWGKPTPVSSESYRLLNSAAWTPDSQYIAGRKHYTSRRSAGAGEIWLYHWTGGDGLQMVEKPNEQKDLGEPAFSPDGRYLYYSQDTTPGTIFEYNKDSNGQIYTIQRLDRTDGRVERLIDGPGGAIRPTPSPDGEMLAFLRRVRFQTVLFVRDLRTGDEWPLYDGMERDMQETWAIHGVYPGIAWTPDSQSIVFWAGGKIQKIDARGPSGGLITEIPFRVRDKRTIYDHVLTPQTAWDESFDVKMLRSGCRSARTAPRSSTRLWGISGSRIWRSARTPSPSA